MESGLLLALLAALDIDASKVNIENQLEQLEEQLKKIIIKIELDPESITSFTNQLEELRRLQQQVQTPQQQQQQGPLDRFTDMPQQEVPPHMQQMVQYGAKLQETLVGLNYSMEKFTHDTDTGMSQAVVRIEEANGSIKKLTPQLDQVTGVITGLDRETIFNQIEKQTKQASTSLNQMESELGKINRLYTSSSQEVERQEERTRVLAQAEEKRSQTFAKINQMAKDGIISKEKEAELVHQLETSYNKLLNTNENLQEQHHKSIADQKAKEALVQYKEISKELETQNKLYEKGEVIEAQHQKETQALETKLQTLQETIKASEKYSEQMQTVDRRRKAGETAEKNKQAREQEKKVLQEIAQLQERKTKAQQAEIQARKNLRPDIEKEQAAVAKQINTEMTQLVATLQEQGRGRGGLLKNTEEGLANIRANAETAQASLRKLREEANREAERKMEDRYGSVVTHTGTGELIPPVTAETEKSEEAMQRYIRLLYGKDAVLQKTVHSTDTAGRVGKQYNVVLNEKANKQTHLKLTLDRTNQALRETSRSLVETRNRTLSFGQQVEIAITRMTQWAIAGTMIYGTLRKIREGFGFIAELDKEITQVAIIQNMAREDAKYLASDYAKLAEELSKTVGEVAKVSTELVRQGLSLAEAQERMQTVLKLSVAGAVGTQDSLKLITTAINAMRVGHERAADVILRASQISASGVEDLGEAFTKAASSSYAAGVSIEQTTAMIAGMIQTTQEGANRIGTSMKTILARFNRVNEETGEWNENLNRVQAAMESVGVEFVDHQGQIRGVYDILGDLAEVWTDLDKNTQAYIATQAAGVRMQNRFFAIMNSWENISDIQEELINSAGTLEQGYDIALTSVEASANRAQAAMESLWIETINSDVMIHFNELTVVLLKTLKALGGVETAIVLLTIGMLAKMQVLGTAIERVKLFAAHLNIAGIKALFAGSGIKVLNAAIVTLGTVLKTTILPALAIAAAIYGATKAVKGLTNVVIRHNEAVKVAADEYIRLRNNLGDINKTAEETIKRIEELEGLFFKFGGFSSAPIDEQREYLQLISTLSEQYKFLLKEGQELEDFLKSGGYSFSDLPVLANEHFREHTEKTAENFGRAIRSEWAKVFRAGEQALEDETIATIMAKVQVEGTLDESDQDLLETFLRSFDPSTIFDELDFSDEIIPLHQQTQEALENFIEDLINTINETDFDLSEFKDRGVQAIKDVSEGLITPEEGREIVASLTKNAHDVFLAAGIDEEMAGAAVQILSNMTRQMNTAIDQVDFSKMDIMTFTSFFDQLAGGIEELTKVQEEYNETGTLTDEVREKLYEESGQIAFLYEEGQALQELINLLEERKRAEEEVSIQQLKNIQLQKQRQIGEKEIRQLEAVKRGPEGLEEYIKLEEEIKELKAESMQLSEQQAIIEYRTSRSIRRSQSELLDSFKNTTEGLKDLIGYLDDYGEVGTFSYENIIDMMDKYSEELGDVLHDEELLYSRIQELVKNTEDQRIDAYRDMLLANESYSKNLIQNNEQLYSIIASIYGKDLEGFANLATAKAEIEAKLIKSLGDYWKVYLSFTQQELSVLAREGDFHDDDYRNLMRMKGLLESIDNISLHIPDFSSSLTRSTSAAREFSEELDFIQIKLENNARKISILQSELERTFSTGQRRKILNQISTLYYESQQITNRALVIYRENLAKELAKLPQDLQKQVQEGDFSIQLITDEETANTIKNIQTLQSTIQSLEDQLGSLGQSIIENFQNRLVDGFRQANFALDELSHQLGLLDDDIENFDTRNQLLASNLVILEDQLRSVEKAFEALKYQYDAGLIDEQQFLTLQNFLHEERRNIENNIHRFQQQRYNEALRLAEEEVSIKKKLLEEEKKNALDAINAKLKAEEKAHRKRMEILDEELKTYNDIIDAKLRTLDREEDQRTYEQELMELQQERSKIQEEINILQLDDSLEARNKIYKLTEDLNEQDKKISELQHRRNIDLRRQNLNDLKENKKNEIDEIKKAENEKFNLFKENLEFQRELEQEDYDQRLQDEQYFNDMKQGIIEAHLSDIHHLHDHFRNQWINSEMEAYARLSAMLDELARKRAEVARMEVQGEPMRGIPTGSTDTGEAMFLVNKGTAGSFVEESRSSIIARQRKRYEEALRAGNQEFAELIRTETASAIGEPRFKFLQGGETVSTGLHWLDATRQRPERVLSQEQTAMFGKLVDWLPQLENLTSKQQPIENQASLVINNLLNVEGNVDEEIMPDLNKMVKEAVKELQRIQKKNLIKSGITRGVSY